MNLLSNGQEIDLNKRILSVLRQLGITEEENVTDSEMEKARKFFDFSKEIDLSLLEGLKIRKLNYDVVHHDSCRLFEEMLRLPKSITMEATDRYILFLDALAGDTIGRFIYNYSYMYENTEANTRIHHAYERKYPIEELQPKMLAYSAYGLNKERLLYSKQLLLAAAKNPRDLYRGGKYYCTDNWCFSRERLYSLALAYRKQDSFTSDELNEMEKHLLMVEKSMSSNFNIDLENLILMLFMSINYGAKIRNRFQARFKVKSDTKTLTL